MRAGSVERIDGYVPKLPEIYNRRYHRGPTLDEIKAGDALIMGHKSSGAESSVFVVQGLLNRFDLGLVEDGYYGPLTARAVQQFQIDNGLSPDGRVGPLTLAKLIEVDAKRREAERDQGTVL